MSLWECTALSDISVISRSRVFSCYSLIYYVRVDSAVLSIEFGGCYKEERVLFGLLVMGDFEGGAGDER